MANGASAAEIPTKTGEGRERREGQEIMEGKTNQQAEELWHLGI